MNGPHRKPQADIYTTLLAIALAAIILATIFAYLETADYGENKYQGALSVDPVDHVALAPDWPVLDRVGKFDFHRGGDFERGWHGLAKRGHVPWLKTCSRYA